LAATVLLSWRQRSSTGFVSGELLHHSDRGSQYASADYQELLRSAKVTCSMSRKGNCWDNAPVESFFSTLKRELVHHRRFRTRSEARSELFEFLEVCTTASGFTRHSAT
jgi:transposase InsO family protein